MSFVVKDFHAQRVFDVLSERGDGAREGGPKIGRRTKTVANLDVHKHPLFDRGVRKLNYRSHIRRPIEGVGQQFEQPQTRGGLLGVRPHREPIAAFKLKNVPL